MTRPRHAAHGLVTATINDVAARAGVSKRTVSRVMNGQPHITAETRARVLAAMERLGYRPNPAARLLASGRSHLIGLLHSPGAPPDPALVDQIALEMAEHRYRVLVCAAEDATLARVVPIDAAILCAPLSEQRAIGAAFQAQNTPCVLLGTAGSNGVCADDREAARQMTGYLASLGHRRIGFVCGPANLDSARQRLMGFRDGMQLAALPIEPGLVQQGADTFDSGIQCGHQLLRGDFPQPTAIFASNDDMAAGVLFAAHERKIGVPRALSVAGFGDGRIASQVWPSLTSVRPPTRQLASRAVALLLAQLTGVSEEEAVPPMVPNADLVIRNSTGAQER